ncbi:protein G12-like [Malaya genurostris]|uniref:protein G12-like n=1 Tax=Malaya genurostris TaxID=325434 RepID=UPI0026F3EBE8|nr:protein G12-like [Malaya genurostris]
MKLLLPVISFALVAVAVVQSTHSTSLQDDLDEFVELLPMDKITTVAIHYFLTDREVRAAVQYLRGPEFATIWDQVFSLQEVRDILNYLEQEGVHAYQALNDLAKLLGVKPIKPVKLEDSLSVSTRGLNDLIEDVVALIPTDELLALYEKKMSSSDQFKAFYNMLNSTDFHKFEELFNSSPELQSMFRKLREYGVDVDRFLDLIKGFFDWGY